jgi:probable F420-dependent oxidoreductase
MLTPTATLVELIVFVFNRDLCHSIGAKRSRPEPFGKTRAYDRKWSRMKIGLYLPTYGPELSWSLLRDVTQAAEDVGIDAVFSCDHLLDGALIESQRGCPPDIYECWTVLSALAAVTKTIRLGSSVASIPYRPPGILAKAAATLDNISDGRLILGLGAGWNEPEFVKHGIPWETPPTRLRMLAEAVQIIKGIWRQPAFSLDGEFWSVQDAECHPAPVQVGGPPVWIGGVGPRARKLVAKSADGWLPVFITPDNYRDLNQELDHEIELAERAASEVTRAYLCFASIDDSDEAAFNSARAFINDLGNHQVDGKRPLDVAATCIVGSVESALSQVATYARSGVNYLILGIMPMERAAYLRNIEFIGANLLPVLTQEASSWST